MADVLEAFILQIGVVDRGAEDADGGQFPRRRERVNLRLQGNKD